MEREFFLAKGSPALVSENGWSPNTDIFETKTELIIRVEIAGVDKNRISVNLTEDTLRIRGRRMDVRHVERVYYHQMEIAYGPFEKVIVLPEPLRTNDIEATYRDGILEIVISKIASIKSEPITIRIED